MTPASSHLQGQPSQRRLTARATARGFTMLEALLALSLMIVLLSGVFGFYMTTLQARQTGAAVSREAMMAHSMLKGMAEEIRQATDVIPGDGLAFSGTHDRIMIVKASMPEAYAFNQYDSVKDELPPAQLDLRRITYELIWSEDLTNAGGDKICRGLFRTEQKTFDPNPKFVIKGSEEPSAEEEEDKPPGGAVMPVDRELFAPEIKYLRFRFFDGAKWQDRWQNQQEQNGEAGGEHALPQAVEITIGRVPVQPEDEELNITQMKETEERLKNLEHHPDRFTAVVYLLQADQSLLSSRKYGAKNNDELEMGGGQ